MNGSELLLPFVVAEQRRRADQAVLVRLALETRNSKSGTGDSGTRFADRLRRPIEAVLYRGQLGPAQPAQVC